MVMSVKQTVKATLHPLTDSVSVERFAGWLDEYLMSRNVHNKSQVTF